MPPREFRTPRDKREELKTYRDLTLGRELKTIRHRRRVQANGKRRVLGDGSGTQPYLAVEAARYREVRLEVQKQLLLDARASGLNLAADQLLRQVRPRIEALTYQQLAREDEDAAARQKPATALGRGLTVEEQKHFADARAVAPVTGQASPGKVSSRALSQVLEKIDQRQAHNPARYQTLWAQVVGGDAAQQTHLERVDAATQTAYFRCFNSVLSNDLQRRPGLPQKLARALGLPVRRLRAQF